MRIGDRRGKALRVREKHERKRMEGRGQNRTGGQLWRDRAKRPASGVAGQKGNKEPREGVSRVDEHKRGRGPPLKVARRARTLGGRRSTPSPASDIDRKSKRNSRVDGGHAFAKSRTHVRRGD